SSPPAGALNHSAATGSSGATISAVANVNSTNCGGALRHAASGAPTIATTDTTSRLHTHGPPASQPPGTQPTAVSEWTTKNSPSQMAGRTAIRRAPAHSARNGTTTAPQVSRYINARSDGRGNTRSIA